MQDRVLCTLISSFKGVLYGYEAIDFNGQNSYE